MGATDLLLPNGRSIDRGPGSFGKSNLAATRFDSDSRRVGIHLDRPANQVRPKIRKAGSIWWISFGFWLDNHRFCHRFGSKPARPTGLEFCTAITGGKPLR